MNQLKKIKIVKEIEIYLESKNFKKDLDQVKYFPFESSMSHINEVHHCFNIFLSLSFALHTHMLMNQRADTQLMRNNTKKKQKCRQEYRREMK